MSRRAVQRAGVAAGCSGARHAPTRSYERHNCPIAQALSLVGDQWTLLIVRDLLSRPRRFDRLQQELGLSRNLLARRLRQLADDGLVERVPMAGSRRFEYRATEKCHDLRTAVAPGAVRVRRRCQGDFDATS